MGFRQQQKSITSGKYPALSGPIVRPPLPPCKGGGRGKAGGTQNTGQTENTLKKKGCALLFRRSKHGRQAAQQRLSASFARPGMVYYL